MKFFAATVLFLILPGCGTFSVIRPADTLKQNQVEISGGVTANSLPEVLVVGKVDYGVLDRLEIGGQYEVYSWLVGARVGLLSTEKNGIALALGLQTGKTVRLLDLDFSDGKSHGDGAFTLAPSLTIGRRWDWIEPYLGVKYFSFPSKTEDFIFAAKLGFRFHPTDQLFLFIEGGTATHSILGGAYSTLGEGALGIGWLL